MDEITNQLIELSKENKILSDKLNNLEQALNSHHTLFETLYLNYEIKPKGVLKKIHILSQELLTFLDNICAKYELDYWLDFGTLLGAVRHETFIPWDDDLDAGMMREDYKKLYPLIQEEVKKHNFEYEIIITDSNRTSPTMLIPFYQLSYFDRSLKRSLVHLDIFPYDYLKTDEGITQEFFSKIRYDYYIKVHNGIPRNDVMNEVYNSLNLTYDKTDLILPGVDGALGSLYPLSILKTNEIFPLKTIKFINRSYKCPNNSKNILKKIYGNYLTIPKIVRDHGILKFVKPIDNILEIYDNAIDRMIELNELIKE